MKLLQQFLSQHFSYEELLFFCFDEQAFNIIYQNLPKPPQVVNAEIIANQLKPQLLNQILHYAQQPDLRVKLETWAKRCKPKEYAEMIPLKQIPVVIAAMSEIQFIELFENNLDFQTLLDKLVRIGWSLDELQKCYGATPSDWRPWHDTSIKEILRQTEDFLTLYKGDEYNFELADKSLPFFDEDQKTISDFQEQESILIIDALSMYYEPIKERVITDSGITAHSAKTQVLVISPIMESLIIGDNLQKIYESHLKTAFHNFIQCNQFFTFHITNKSLLQQFLLATSPYINQAAQFRKQALAKVTSSIRQQNLDKKNDIEKIFIPKK